MHKRRILIVDNNDELRLLLEKVLGQLGHDVVVTGERKKALRRDDFDSFDLIISDLSDAESNGQPVNDIKAFKLGAANYPRRAARNRRTDTRLQTALRRRCQSSFARSRKDRV